MGQLKQEIEKQLTDKILPFWMKLKDEENGGFYGEVDYDLTINKEGPKGGIAAARFLWSFSAAYRVTMKEEYLSYAHHAYRFLSQKAIDPVHKGLYWMLDHKGNPIDTRKHIYTQAFGIYALSEFYRAFKHPEALKLARELYELIETKGYDEHTKAYKEEFNREWIERSNEMLSEHGLVSDITTNTHLHVLEAYTNLYRVWPSQQLKEKLTNLVYTFYQKIYDYETKFQKVFFDKKWQELMDLKSYGHDIEASWLLDEAVKVLDLKDENISKMIIDIAYNIAEHGVLEDGSVANEEKEGKVDCTRVWWVQAESMVGFYNAYERTGDKKFLNLVDNLWKYTKENLIDSRDEGEWFWSVEPDGKPTKRPVAEPWKTPYHNSRFCLEMIERMSR